MNSTYSGKAIRDLRCGEEIRADDLIYAVGKGLVPVASVRPGMVGHPVLGERSGHGAPPDNVFRLRAKAPPGYRVKDWQTEYHAYAGGTFIGQYHTRKEAIAACWEHCA